MNTYEVITERIIEAIETNKTLPWRRPWSTYPTNSLPRNFFTKKAYHGINVFLLSMMGFQSPYWLTFKQAKDLGGFVRKGEKGCPVVFWSVFEKTDPDTKKVEKIPFIKHSTVFNVEQCEGLELPEEDEPATEINPIETCEDILQGFKDKPEIIEREQQAFYSLSQDLVNMPVRDSFDCPEEYYSTLFHELAHSTAHPSRLGRKLTQTVTFFGSEDYSKEELIAEFASSFLCAKAGIDSTTENNSVSYLQGWVSALREKPKMLIEAAQQAQKAANYILGETRKTKEDE